MRAGDRSLNAREGAEQQIERSCQIVGRAIADRQRHEMRFGPCADNRSVVVDRPGGPDPVAGETPPLATIPGDHLPVDLGNGAAAVDRLAVALFER